MLPDVCIAFGSPWKPCLERLFPVCGWEAVLQKAFNLLKMLHLVGFCRVSPLHQELEKDAADFQNILREHLRPE